MLRSDIELVVTQSKILEARLKQVLDAKGRGLGQLTNSVKWKLPSTTFHQLHEVNDLRNEIVHEVGRNVLENKLQFEQLCSDIERSLDKLEYTEQNEAIDLGCMLIIFIFVLTICFLSQTPL